MRNRCRLKESSLATDKQPHASLEWQDTATWGTNPFSKITHNRVRTPQRKSLKVILRGHAEYKYWQCCDQLHHSWGTTSFSVCLGSVKFTVVIFILLCLPHWLLSQERIMQICAQISGSQVIFCQFHLGRFLLLDKDLVAVVHVHLTSLILRWQSRDQTSQITSMQSYPWKLSR